MHAGSVQPGERDEEVIQGGYRVQGSSDGHTLCRRCHHAQHTWRHIYAGVYVYVHACMCVGCGGGVRGCVGACVRACVRAHAHPCIRVCMHGVVCRQAQRTLRLGSVLLLASPGTRRACITEARSCATTTTYTRVSTAALEHALLRDSNRMLISVSAAALEHALLRDSNRMLISVSAAALEHALLRDLAGSINEATPAHAHVLRRPTTAISGKVEVSRRTGLRHLLRTCMCMCVCVCAGMRVCGCACVCVRACVCACMHACPGPIPIPGPVPIPGAPSPSLVPSPSHRGSQAAKHPGLRTF